MYDPAIRGVILDRIADGESLRAICSEEGMPTRQTVRLWLSQDPEFLTQYARAREEQADTYADEIAAIADEPPPMVVDRQGEAVGGRMDSAFVSWQRNRIDDRKWVASKLKPKKYADKIDLTHAAPEGGPVNIRVLFGRDGS